MSLVPDPQVPDPLDELERSIEQAFPSDVDMFADPLCRALDDLEISIENQQSPDLPAAGSLYGAIDKLEDNVLQGLSNSTQEQVLATHDPLYSGVSDFGSHGAAGGPESKKMGRDSEEGSSERQSSAIVPKMRGRSGSGTGNSGDKAGCYCYLYEVWVTEDECESCTDFEEDEYASKDEGEKRCKHSFFPPSEDLG